MDPASAADPDDLEPIVILDDEEPPPRRRTRRAAPVDLTPAFLRDLCAYARSRLLAGAAVPALAGLGIVDAGFVSLLGLGFWPAEVRRVLNAAQRRALGARLIPSSVVVPACDAQGTIVDLCIVPADGSDPVLSLFVTPRGLIAPATSTAFPALIIVDSLRAAHDAVAAGEQVLFLRGLPDAQANAATLAANGVRRVVLRVAQDRAAIAACLQAAGITVADTLADPTPADLVLASHDQQAELATFTAGDLTFVAEVPWDARSLVSVRIQRGGQEHADRIDLGAEAQRRRCASSAALRTGAPAAVIAAHLAEVHDAIQDLVRQVAAPPAGAATPTLTDAERTAALALAQAPDLLEQIVADLGRLGWVGESATQRCIILAALSRLCEDPVWIALTGAGAAGLDAIAAITPPEAAIHVSRLTDSAFYHAESDALRHKLLLIDDASRVSAGVATALRVLKRRGALSANRLTTDPVRGQPRTTFVEVTGPVAVLTATDGAIDAQLQSHLIEVATDDAPAQVAAMLAARRRRCAQVGMGHDRERIITRLRNLQRVLAPRPVLMPFAERITGFGTSAQARRDHDTLLALIASHALLHQHQRAVLDGTVVATEADFAVAAGILHERQAAQDAGLGRHAQRLLAAVWAEKLTTFTMEDLARLLPDWTRYTYRAALDDLVALDYLASPRSGRGTARIYQLHGSPSAGTTPAARITLRPVGELATVGETASPTPTREMVNG